MTITANTNNTTTANAEWAVYMPTCSAPAARGGKYRRPRNVWVVLATGDVKAIHGKNVIAKELIATNVDSRYDGERSAFGQAVRAADKRIAELTAV